MEPRSIRLQGDTRRSSTLLAPVCWGFVLFCVMSILAGATIPVPAGEPSDVAVFEVDDFRSGKIEVKPGAGASLEDFFVSGAGGLFNMRSLAPVVEVIEQPFFDEALCPGEQAAWLHKIVFGPVTVSTRDRIIATIGHGVLGPPLTEDVFRDQLFVNYEVEVDGVMVQGDALGVVLFNLEGVGATVFNVVLQIATPGTHRVVNRFLTKRDFPEGEPQLAGVYEHHYTVVVVDDEDEDEDEDED